MSQGDLRDNLVQASSNLAAYAGSDVSAALVAVLDALELSYMQDLVSVKPEGLAELQACVRQVQVLRKLAEGDASELPKI